MRSKLVTRNYAFDGDYLKWYTKYSEYLDNSKLAKETCDWRLKHIRIFIDNLQNDNVVLKRITEKDIINCIEKSVDGLSKRTIENRVTCLKHFLLFLRDKRAIKLTKEDIPIIVRKPLHK